MDHEEIGHRDSNNERCPVCRRDDEITTLTATLRKAEAERDEARKDRDRWTHETFIARERRDKAEMELAIAMEDRERIARNQIAVLDGYESALATLTATLTAAIRKAEAKSEHLSACLAEVTEKLSARSAELAGNAVALATERAARIAAEEVRDKNLDAARDIFNRLAEFSRMLDTERAARESAEAELALRKDYADQVRAQSATIIRLGQEIEVADKARESAEQLAVWASRHGAFIKTDAGILAALRRAVEGEK